MFGLAISHRVGLGVAILALVCVGTAYADTWTLPADALWYNGDPNGAWLWNSEASTGWGSGYVYEEFIVPAGVTWNVTEIWGNFESDGIVPSVPVNWQIWSGMSTGNYGALMGSGIAETASITQTGSGSVVGGWPDYEIDISRLDIALAPGTYWVGMEPDAGAGRTFILTTSGQNAIAPPPVNEDNSYSDFSIGDPGNLAESVNGGNPIDYSYGVGGVTPEPISMIFFGTGLVAVSGYISRRKMLRKA